MGFLGIIGGLLGLGLRLPALLGVIQRVLILLGLGGVGFELFRQGTVAGVARGVGQVGSVVGDVTGKAVEGIKVLENPIVLLGIGLVAVVLLRR